MGKSFAEVRMAIKAEMQARSRRTERPVTASTNSLAPPHPLGAGEAQLRQGYHRLYVTVLALVASPHRNA